MTISVDVHRIKAALAKEYDYIDAPFSAVRVECQSGSSATLYLPVGKAQAVADAINAALGVTE